METLGARRKDASDLEIKQIDKIINKYLRWAKQQDTDDRYRIQLLSDYLQPVAGEGEEESEVA